MWLPLQSYLLRESKLQIIPLLIFHCINRKQTSVSLNSYRFLPILFREGLPRFLIYCSGNDFLTIGSGAESRAEGTGYWFKETPVPNIPECAKVIFRAKINAGQFNGGGAAVALRAYENVVEREGAKLQEFLFLTTEDRPVSGKLENHTEELVIPCFSGKTSRLIIFVVMMPGTTGEVGFGDIGILVKEKQENGRQNFILKKKPNNSLAVSFYSLFYIKSFRYELTKTE